MAKTPPKPAAKAPAKAAPKKSATYGQVTNYKTTKAPAGKTSSNTFTFHDQAFTQTGNKFTRAGGKAVGKAGTSIINAALKARAAKPTGLPGQAAPGTSTAPATTVTADTTPAPAVFNPVGDQSWNGATGLSGDAVSWLNAGADSTYFDDVNSAQRNYDTFNTDLGTQQAQNQLSRTKALTKLGYTYDPTSKTGYWNDSDQTTARGQSLNDMGYDYGARGLLHSSEYAKQLATTNQQFQDQADAMVTAGNQFDASIDSQRSNAQGDLADAKLAAIRNAVQRRAASAGALS